MSNCSKYQNNFWFPKVAEAQKGEYCAGCGIAEDHTWKDKEFTGLVLDKINNDGNHTIKDNTVKDFQLLCISCNKVKNPSKAPDSLIKTQSEKTNQRVEKPLFDWLMHLLRDGKRVKWSWFIANGSHDFDISPDTIEKRYYKKYLSPELENSPFVLWVDPNDEITYIILKNKDNPKTTLDTHTPTPSLLTKQKK